ncbi:hypothetical protein J2Z29_002052 [Treponema pedis]
MLTEHPESSYKDSPKKSAKSFAKAPCFALDIKYRIGQNSQLHSFTASQLHSFTASQLHSFTASQLEGASCPNKQPYSKASRYKNLRTDKFKYRLLKPRPRAKSQSKTDCLFLGFFYITPFNKTARSAER